LLVDQRRYGGRAAATAAALLLFAAIYPLLFARGGAANAALCAIPVLVAGYLWGMGAGAVTGLVVLPLTTIELVALGVQKADLPLTFGQGRRSCS
jgi:thiamine transporter ThiT